VRSLYTTIRTLNVSTRDVTNAAAPTHSQPPPCKPVYTHSDRFVSSLHLCVPPDGVRPTKQQRAEPTLLVCMFTKRYAANVSLCMLRNCWGCAPNKMLFPPSVTTFMGDMGPRSSVYRSESSTRNVATHLERQRGDVANAGAMTHSQHLHRQRVGYPRRSAAGFGWRLALQSDRMVFCLPNGDAPELRTRTWLLCMSENNIPPLRRSCIYPSLSYT
jgi:hypothetical protein